MKRGERRGKSGMSAQGSEKNKRAQQKQQHLLKNWLKEIECGQRAGLGGG